MDKYESQNGRKYAVYELTSEALCLGERMRASTYRPCLKVFGNVGLEGAFRAQFPHPDRRVFAMGRMESFRIESLVYSPRDRSLGISKVPLEIEFLARVRAKVWVRLNDWTIRWPEQFEIALGGMRTSGFGRCTLVRLPREVDAGNPAPGTLCGRMLDDAATRAAFGIRNVVQARYGYVHVAERGGHGFYGRALFEGSKIVADAAILHPAPQEMQMKRNPLDELIETIEQDHGLLADVQSASGKLINNVAEVFERRGTRVTLAFLQERVSRDPDKDGRANRALQKVTRLLDRCEAVRLDRAVGRLVIKCLPGMAREPAEKSTPAKGRARGKQR